MTACGSQGATTPGHQWASLLDRDAAAGFSNSGGPNGPGQNALCGEGAMQAESAISLLKYNWLTRLHATSGSIPNNYPRKSPRRPPPSLQCIPGTNIPRRRLVVWRDGSDQSPQGRSASRRPQPGLVSGAGVSRLPFGAILNEANNCTTQLCILDAHERL